MLLRSTIVKRSSQDIIIEKGIQAPSCQKHNGYLASLETDRSKGQKASGHVRAPFGRNQLKKAFVYSTTLNQTTIFQTKAGFSERSLLRSNGVLQLSLAYKYPGSAHPTVTFELLNLNIC